MTFIENKINDLPRVPRSFGVLAGSLSVSQGDLGHDGGAPALCNHLPAGAARVVSWLLESSIYSLPANQIVEEALLFTGFKTTSLDGRDEGRDFTCSFGHSRRVG